MKIFPAALLILLLVSFKNAKPGNKDFRILYAEKQTIHGGVAGSPSVTVYRLHLLALRKIGFTPDTAWAEGKADAVIVDLDSFNSANSKICRKGDTVMLHFEIRTEALLGGGDYQLKVPGSPETAPPVKTRPGAALIRYKGGKCKYLAVNQIKTIETLFAP